MRASFRNAWSRVLLYCRIAGLLLGVALVCVLALAVVFVVPLAFQPRNIGWQTDLPQLLAAGPRDRVLVVAAHPDDEFLSSGGYLAASVQNKAEVYVALVTNGEASLIADTLSEHELLLPKQYYVAEGNRRPDETKQALAAVGVSASRVYFLGYPVRELKNLLEQNWDKPLRSHYTRETKPVFDNVFDRSAVYTGQSAVSDLTQILQQTQPTIILTHSNFDENTDHQAVYYLVKRALAAARVSSKVPFPLTVQEYFFLVHYRQYSFPGRASYAYRLVPPLDLASQVQWYSFELPRQEYELKRQGMKAFQSQFANPYLRMLLDSFVKRNELFYSEGSQ